MYLLSIDKLLNTFQISQEDIISRQILEEKLPILSKILIERFYEEYIKNNEEISEYFKYTNIENFLEKMQEFIIFVYSAPLDQSYIERIYQIGYLHADIKLDSAKVKYAFFGLNQLLRQISLKDSLVYENFTLISKFLAMIEYVIVDSSYFKYEKTQNITSNKSSIWLLDKIYTIFSIHKNNYTKIENFMQSDNKSILEIDSIISDSTLCTFHKLLKELEQQAELLSVSKININELNELHTQWHGLVAEFKSNIKNSDNDRLEITFSKITLVTNELYELMDKPLKEFSISGFLSLNSGLKAISSINILFSKRSLTLSTEKDIRVNIIDSVTKSLQNTLSWAIEEIVFDYKAFDAKSYNLTKKIKFKEFDFYIGIKLKPLANKLYLEEVLTLLLEALELNFSIKEREVSLREYADKAQSANRSKDAFISNMSHELRTPLTAVNGYSEVLMLRSDTPEHIKEYLKKINIAGNHLLDLVNTILDFAKLESSQMKFKPISSSIYLILQEVELLSVPMAQKKDISLNIIVDLNLYLVVDPKLFKQVLLNLISNAIKFTQEGGSVTLSISYEEETNEYKFSVCDTGIGIAKEDQEKLFHPFVQIQNIYQESTSGSGLGLMICKRIIEELHHGKIWIESEVDKGSCFHITIPTIDTSNNAYCVINASKEAKHILIVEDSHMYQELFKEYLQDKYRLTITETNNIAKSILGKETFDMIILDFYLTDGISSEILIFMEEENINTPVFVISVEDDLPVAKTIHSNNNIQSIINKKDIKEFCKVLNSDLS